MTNLQEDGGLGFADFAFIHWLPDETLFSLASRYHRLSLQVRPETTCLTLFGRRRGGLAHDLPDSVDAFADRTRAVLGCSAQEVIRDRTLLPFYLPFQAAFKANAAVDAMRGPYIGSLKFQLGMLTSRFRANHPLKACLRCMEEDLVEFHAPYWHRQHQLPGTWVCTKHRVHLRESTLKSTGVRRFHWTLPDESDLTTAIGTASEGPCGSSQLETLLYLFASAASGLAALPIGFHFDSIRLASLNRQQLQARGFLRHGNQLSPSAGQSLTRFLAPLNAVRELAPLAVQGSSAQSQLSRLSNPSRVMTHPLRHLAYALWLFESWDRFVESYRKWQCAELPAAEPAGDTNDGDSRHSNLVALVRDKGHSVSRACRIVGIDTTTGMAWLSQAGIAVGRRPKKLRPDVRAALVEALRRGCDKATAATRFNVSIVTITTTLRTTVGLHDEWSRARIETRRAAERQGWLALLVGNQTVGLKLLRRLAPATYAWLYRNDRTWLVEQSASVTGAKRGNHSSVNWDARDQSLATIVATLSIELATESPLKRITLWRLYQRFPELKPKLGHLDRLPLTRAAIDRALKYLPDSSAPVA
ncbi:TnsD family Tn7-like transposition protein [Paucibacter sp. R3-3]|uniref:TnsD family Tn7-like transposition protein n=1 Tax=Roseateles agri TaxID=3098619 RepID=A0ABU5DSI1_9BURK|nr:TnsD family Tn7-like transposition protein [Paucibacter sp. R3-3]MDY0748726.1 TnsD family Tn7-like transposition protein [Paucibacter sp. R3-3]